MRIMPNLLALVLGLYSTIGSGISHADTGDAKLQQALSAEQRSVDERARDSERKPLETLGFFGIKDNMSVLELFPGGGWYTKILGDYLHPHGQLYVGLGTSRLGNRLQEWGYDWVKTIPADVAPLQPSGIHPYVFNLPAFEFPLTDLDMVLTFRNAHNLTSEARNHLNQAVFKALKPGGIYAVVDHTRRHMEPYQPERWRRVDPVQIIWEASQAGFVFDSYSDLHRNPDDDLVLDTTDPTLQRHSDRFILKFRKP